MSILWEPTRFPGRFLSRPGTWTTFLGRLLHDVFIVHLYVFCYRADCFQVMGVFEMMSVRQGLHIGCFSDPLRAFKFCMKTPVFRLHLFLFIGFFSDAVRAFKICIKTPVGRLHMFLHIFFFPQMLWKLSNFASEHLYLGFTCSCTLAFSQMWAFELCIKTPVFRLHMFLYIGFSSDAVRAFKPCIKRPAFRLHMFTQRNVFINPA